MKVLLELLKVTACVIGITIWAMVVVGVAAGVVFSLFFEIMGY